MPEKPHKIETISAGKFTVRVERYLSVSFSDENGKEFAAFDGSDAADMLVGLEELRRYPNAEARLEAEIEPFCQAPPQAHIVPGNMKLITIKSVLPGDRYPVDYYYLQTPEGFFPAVKLPDWVGLTATEVHRMFPLLSDADNCDLRRYIWDKRMMQVLKFGVGLWNEFEKGVYIDSVDGCKYVYARVNRAYTANEFDQFRSRLLDNYLGGVVNPRVQASDAYDAYHGYVPYCYRDDDDDDDDD